LINLSILTDFIDECEDGEERELMFSKIKPIISSLSETFDNLVESLQIREEVGLDYEKNRFAELTQNVLTKHSIEIDVYNIAVNFDFTAAEFILYPKKYLDSILSNLISNAIKYRSTARLPHIHIKTERQGEIISLKVTDNGLGIDLKRNAQHIFKMRKVFHDHPDAKGYGLFMTKTQVDAMEGKIYVESAPDCGTTFTIEFNQKNTIS
jgi:signal transduction histidine kinase